MKIDKTVKYYSSLGVIRSQVPQVLIICVMFVFTLLIASSLKDKSIATLLLFASIAYPTVIAVSILSVIPKINYSIIDDKGIFLTRFGFLHKQINWADIQKIEKTSFSGVDYLGILLKPTAAYRSIGSSFRKKNIGFDLLIENRHQKNGSSLASAVTEYIMTHN